MNDRSIDDAIVFNKQWLVEISSYQRVLCTSLLKSGQQSD